MAKYRSSSDFELIELLKKGDHAAFTEIYHRYWQQTYLHAINIIGDKDKDEAKDAVQDVFIALWKQASGLTLRSSLSGYFYSAVRNKILNLIRDKKVRTDYTDLFALYLNEQSNLVDETVEEKELLQAINDIVSTLPAKMREVFELSRNEQLSHREIAEQLHISEKTVKKQISNALSHLRMKLRKFESLIVILAIIRFK